MTPVLLTLALVLSADPAAVRHVTPDTATISATTVTTDGTAAEKAAASDATPVATAADQAPAPAAPVVMARREGRRRGSMVGYIEDGTIDSHLRVRFDDSGGGVAPDRAEFFYGKCGCYQGLASIDPPAYDPNAPGPAPGVVTDYDTHQLYFEGQAAWHNRIAGFVEIPVRWLDPKGFVAGLGSFGSTSGLSDIRAGVKVALTSSDTHYLTVLVRGEFPSGDAAKGLGTNHGTFVPALLYYQRAGERFAIESQIGDFHPLSGSAGVPTNSSDKFSGDVVFYGIGPSFEVVSTERFRLAPVVELVGWHVTGGFATQVPGNVAGVAVAADGTDIVNLKFGARATFNDRTSIYIGYGKKLTDAGWYNDIVRFEVRVGL